MRHASRHNPALVVSANVTPIWLLPFWRLVKGEAKGDYAAAWKALPKHMPRTFRRPSVEEAATVLVDHGLL